MDKNDKKYIQILSKETEIPMHIKTQANMAYSKILAASRESIQVKEHTTKRLFYRNRFAILAAAFVMVFGTTAFAAVRYWGLSDFFAVSGKEIPKEAIPLIETDVQQDALQNDLIHFKVREAICDNKAVYVVIEARPANTEQYLLVPMDAYYTDPVLTLGLDADDGETISQYAARNNKQMLYVNASLSNNGTYITHSADFTTEEDGTVAFILKGDNISSIDDMTLTCDTTVYPIDLNGKNGEATKGSFDFKLSNKSTEEKVSYQQANPTIVENTGVIVDKIEICKSELGVYTELTFHIAPDATKDQIELAKSGLWFEYLDKEGNRWESGLSGIGTIEEINDGVFVQKNNFNNRAIPDTITIRAYDCWEKDRYGTVILYKV